MFNKPLSMSRGWIVEQKLKLSCSLGCYQICRNHCHNFGHTLLSCHSLTNPQQDTSTAFCVKHPPSLPTLPTLPIWALPLYLGYFVKIVSWTKFRIFSLFSVWRHDTQLNVTLYYDTTTILIETLLITTLFMTLVNDTVHYVFIYCYK